MTLSQRSDEPVYVRDGDFVVFNQLGVKVEMDLVGNEDYYAWLDEMERNIGSWIPGAEIAEKPGARESPPLNTAIYYDTADYKILPTGALLRTSCNKITHAFCAFKAPVNGNQVRRDHRYVFGGDDKRVIQESPASAEAVAIVKEMLQRTDIEHPGIHLRHEVGVEPRDVFPAVILDDLRFTFFAWLDGRDALRCSMDRYHVSDLRLPQEQRERVPLSEVELSIYPRIDEEIAHDPRVPELIGRLAESLCERFGVSLTTDIKYQRSARALSIGGW
jgi:hypothetical protein